MSPVQHRLSTVAAATVLLLLPASAAWAAPANHRPAVPAALTVGGIGCRTGGILIGTTTPRIAADFADPDLGQGGPERLTPTFAWWPAGRPANRVEWTAATLTSPARVMTTGPAALVNGDRYHLAARAVDTAGARSAWSPVCTFTVDTTVPNRPLVTSADYPENANSGSAGVPGTFTFTAAGGDKDVATFRYRLSGGPLLEVPADRDGRATVVITPANYGEHILTVQAVDRTANRSAETDYAFSVLDNHPRVIQDDTDTGPGEPRTIRFWNAVPGTASFTYHLADGPATTVAADADGWATVTVVPNRRGDNLLTVTSRTADGIVSPETRINVYVSVQVPQPVISSPDFPGDGTPPPTAGRTVTIILHAGSPDVTELAWSGDFGETFQTVAADRNGNATVSYVTPDWALYLEVQARARTADGFESDITYAGWELTPAE